MIPHFLTFSSHFPRFTLSSQDQKNTTAVFLNTSSHIFTQKCCQILSITPLRAIARLTLLSAPPCSRTSSLVQRRAAPRAFNQEHNLLVERPFKYIPLEHHVQVRSLLEPFQPCAVASDKQNNSTRRKQMQGKYITVAKTAQIQHSAIGNTGCDQQYLS